MAKPSTGTLLHHLAEMIGAAPLQNKTDADLIEQFSQSHDEEAFSGLVDRHRRLVWSVCRQVLGHVQDAEDAFQATFLLLARHANSIRGGQAVASWLYRVAYRASLKALAANSKRREREGSMELMTDHEPHAELAWRELQTIVQQELGRLPESQRSVFVLCCLEEKSKSEAARELGLNEGTVSSRLARARKLLQSRLERRGITLAAILTVGAVTSTAPAAVVNATVQGALALAEHSVNAGVISAKVLALMDAVGKAFLVGKSKIAVTIMLAVLIAGTGTGVIAYGALAGTQRPQNLTNQRIGKNDSQDAKRGGDGFTRDKKESRLDSHGDPLPEGALGRLGAVRWRHGSHSRRVAFSPDGSKILSSGYDGKLRIWDATNGKELRRIALDSNDRGDTIAFSADGNEILLARNESVRSWNLADGSLKSPSVPKSPDLLGRFSHLFFRDPNRDIRRTTVWSRNGKVNASAELSEITVRPEKETGWEARTLKFDFQDEVVLALSPNGKYLAAGRLGMPEVVVWDVASGNEIHRLKVKYDCLSLAFSPDSKSLVAGGQDVSILHWDISTGKEIGRFRQRGGWPAGLTFSDDGKKLAVAAEAVIRIWDVVKQKELNLDSEPYDRIWSVALSEDDKTLAASDYNSVRFWDPDSGKEVGRSSSSFVGAYRLAFLHGGRTLVSTAYDQELRAWNVPSGKELFHVSATEGSTLCLTTSPNGRFIASAVTLKQQRKMQVHLRDSRSGKLIQTIADLPGDVKSLAFSPDSKLLATGCFETELGHGMPAKPKWISTIVLWDMSTFKPVRTIRTSTPPCASLAFSSDGTILAVCPSEGGMGIGVDKQDFDIRLWNVKTGEEIRHFGSQTSGYHQIVFSRDGRMLVSAGEDGVVRVWEVATGKELKKFLGHAAPVTSVAITSDGKRVISGSEDTTVLIWDMSALAGGGRESPK